MLTDNPYWPAHSPRPVGVMSDVERDEHTSRFLRGECLFNPEDGKFMKFRRIEGGLCFVRIHRQGGSIYRQTILLHDLRVMIQAKQWVIEDGPYDPGGFGWIRDIRAQQMVASWASGGANALIRCAETIRRERDNIDLRAGDDLASQVIRTVATIQCSENAWRAEQTKAGLKAARARGVKLGCPRPQRTPGMEIAAAAARTAKARQRACDILPMIQEIRAAGMTSHRAIAAELNRREMPTPSRRGKWHSVTVMRVLEQAT